MSQDQRYALVTTEWMDGELVLHVRHRETEKVYQHRLTAADAVEVAKSVITEVFSFA